MTRLLDYANMYRYKCKEDSCDKTREMFCVTHDIILCHEHWSTLHNECEIKPLFKTENLKDKIEHIETYFRQISEYSKLQYLDVRIPHYSSLMSHYTNLIGTLKDQVTTAIAEDAFTTFEGLHCEAIK